MALTQLNIEQPFFSGYWLTNPRKKGDSHSPLLTCWLLNWLIPIGLIQEPPGSKSKWVKFNSKTVYMLYASNNMVIHYLTVNIKRINAPRHSAQKTIQVLNIPMMTITTTHFIGKEILVWLTNIDTQITTLCTCRQKHLVRGTQVKMDVRHTYWIRNSGHIIMNTSIRQIMVSKYMYITGLQTFVLKQICRYSETCI